MHVFSCIHLPNNYLNIRVCLFVCLCVGYFRGLTGSSCLVTQLRVHTAFMEVSVCVCCVLCGGVYEIIIIISQLHWVSLRDAH